jgi:hypothetical protein
MKNARRKRSVPPVADPTPDQLRQYMSALANNHHQDFQIELNSAAPYWEYLLAVHLRLAELEHLEAAAVELL